MATGDAGTPNDAGIDGTLDAGGDDAGVDAGAPDAGAPDAGPTLPGTPVLTSAQMVVHGTNSIAWQLPTSGCSTVELNRKKDAGAYAVAKTLTGVATSTQDSPGHSSGVYCYTIVCKLNGFASSPSNEKCVAQ